MTPSTKTFCRICEAHCGLIVERDETGNVSKLRPDGDHPLSQGFVCAKGLKFLGIADHPARVLHPQLRDADGTLRPVSWDAAYTEIGARLRRIIAEDGVHAVGVYFGTPMIHHALLMLTLFQWIRALGTRNLYSAASQDNANKLVAQKLIHGREWIMPIMDLEHADFALLLGTNPVVSQGTFVHMPGGTKAYDAFVKRGGKLVIVDPRRTESAQRWGGHIAIRPGTDVFLLLALLHELADEALTPRPPLPQGEGEKPQGIAELRALAAAYPADRAADLTGISADQIRELARELRTAERATIFNGVGVNQSASGLLCVILIQAIAYLTGNFDQRGGLLFNRWAKVLQLLVGIKPQRSRIGGYTSHAGGLPCGILADEILTEGAGQIRALIVVGGNPLTSIAEETKLRRAFASLDLLVSIDIFENDTGALADAILPGLTWLERFDVGAWDAMYETAPLLQTSARVRSAPGNTRSEARIIAELSIAAGQPIFWNRFLARLWARIDWDRVVPVLIRPLQWLFRRRLAGAEGLPWPAAKPGLYAGRRRKRLRFWHDDLNAASARLVALAAQLETTPAEGEFLLLGRRRRLAQNSWVHNAKEARAWLAPADMQRLGLADGDAITIRSAVGELTLPVAGHASVSPGSVVVPHGLPGINVNRLIPSDQRYIEPVSGMHQMSGHRVTVRRVE